MENATIGFFIGLFVAALIIKGFASNLVKTNKILIPDLEINIKNSIADTTYIYKLK